METLNTYELKTYSPEIPGLPNLVFVKMGLKERGLSSRAYSSKLKELMDEGGYLSEALLPTTLKKACENNGVDPTVQLKGLALTKQFFNSIPPDLAGPFDHLTQDQVAALPEEEQAARAKAIDDRGHVPA
ncbi:MAG: hypothetical protein U1D96_03515 [Eubacteriales bacterium]|nr:hypothetical protein [Eubacteriales bacterium]